MKKIIVKTLLTWVCLTGYTYITAQTLPEVDGKVIYQDLRLEKEDGKMVLTFDTQVLDKALNNRQSWKVMPELIPAGTGQSLFFPSLLINGRQKERHYKRRLNYRNKELLANYPLIHTHVPQDKEQLIHYRAEIPYESWMENASLTFHQILTSPREKKQLFTTQGLVRLTPEPVAESVIPPKVIPRELPTLPVFQINGEAYVHFRVNEAVIHTHLMNNQSELNKIEKDLKELLDHPDHSLLGIQLTGYASPDGRFATNARLSEERTRALKAYISKNHGIDAGLIRTSHVPEDWERFRELVENSNLTNKQQLLAIIDSGESPETKESRLRAMPATWNLLLK